MTSPTGRTKRTNGMNPNLQNIPLRTERGREFRKALAVASEKSEILNADYSEVEQRCADDMAVVFGCFAEIGQGIVPTSKGHHAQIQFKHEV